MTDPPVIDAHLHLWDLSSGGYRWLTTAHGALHATFEAGEAAAELADAGVDGAVLVQADDTEADTDAMLAVATEHLWVLGVVGWLRLDDTAEAERQLERRLRQPPFCGVRHLVHGDPRRDFLELPAVHRSLGLLARHGLALDVPDAWPHHLGQVESLAARLPDLTIVLDHLGKPPRGRNDFDAWRAGVERLAAHPGTVAKLSGLRMPGMPYTAEALRPVWEIALKAFGPDRVLWGSDWPMTVPEGGYGPTAEVLRELIGELSAAEQAAVLGGTAERVYRLTQRRRTTSTR
jgi:L-fuconolactonase